MTAAALACLPDLDYLPGLAAGSLNAFHQQGTHSLAWVFLAAAAVWLAAGGSGSRPVSGGAPSVFWCC